MPIIYEVPTHLNVRDTILFGLGARQLIRLVAGASVGYLLWDQATLLPPEMRLALAGVAVAFGVACALLEPGGRPLDRWVVAAVFYLLLPRRLTWRCVERGSRTGDLDTSGWAELSPAVAWTDLPRSSTGTHSQRSRP